MLVSAPLEMGVVEDTRLSLLMPYWMVYVSGDDAMKGMSQLMVTFSPSFATTVMSLGIRGHPKEMKSKIFISLWVLD